jgi:hypothetical protein
MGDIDSLNDITAVPIRRGTADRLGLRHPQPPSPSLPAFAAAARILRELPPLSPPKSAVSGIFTQLMPPMAMVVTAADLRWHQQVRQQYEQTQRARLLP